MSKPARRALASVEDVSLSGEFSRENQHAPAEVVRSASLWLPLDRIQDNPYQYRQHYGAADVLDLALNISQSRGDRSETLGLQQLPAVRLGKLVDGKFEPLPKLLYSDSAGLRRIAGDPHTVAQLHYGHRRNRAWRILARGVAEVFLGKLDRTLDELVAQLQPDPAYAQMPVIAVYADNETMWRQAVTENAQRKDATPIDEAHAISRAIQDFGYTYEQAAQPFGYSAKGTISNKLRLLNLPAETQTAIASGLLSERHGRELLRLVEYGETSAAKLIELTAKAIKDAWPVSRLTNEINYAKRIVTEKIEEQRQIASARQAARTWRLPGQTDPVGEACVQDNTDWMHIFDRTDRTDLALLRTGLCGPHCACFAIRHQTKWQAEKGYSPAPTDAPCVVAGCTSRDNTRAQKKAELQKQHANAIQATEKELKEEEEKRRKTETARQFTETMEQEWKDRTAKLDMAKLWTLPAFWRLLLEVSSIHLLSERMKTATDTNGLYAAALEALWSHAHKWNNELSCSLPSDTQIDRILGTLANLSGRKGGS